MKCLPCEVKLVANLNDSKLTIDVESLLQIKHNTLCLCYELSHLIN